MIEHTPAHPAIGRTGEPATAVEVALVATPAPAEVLSPSEQLRAIGHRIAETLLDAGIEARHAQHAAAVAVVAFLDELGASRVRFPTRRGFFLQLLRPELPRLCAVLRRNNVGTAQIAHSLGICRRTVERALAAHCDNVGQALSQVHQTDSRG